MGMDTVEFVMQVEEDFEINIDEVTAANIFKIKDICIYILNSKKIEINEENIQRVFCKIKQIILDLGMNEEREIKLTSRFIEDLGWD